jgi:hypothetical protein
MQSAKKTISPLLYFILISSLTNLVFLAVGIVLLALFSVKLSSFGLQIIMFLLLWKGVLVGFVAWFSHKRANNKDFLVTFIGIYLGRFFGLLIGGFVGAQIFEAINQSGIIGLIVGALALYFAGRWIGSKVSMQIGKQLERVFYVPGTQISEKIVDIKSTNRFAVIGFIMYGVLLPILLVIVGLLRNYFKVLISGFTEWLSISRLVVIALSIFSVGYPWLMRKRWLTKFQSKMSSPESAIYWAGLVFSIIPVVYGFLLFIIMGASILELCVYAIVSSVAAILWSINNGVFGDRKAG